MKEKIFQRKDQVIEAALEEFTRKDYEKASLNTIIKNAGISKGTFYYHFKDKEALYIFVLKIGVDAKWQYIGEASEEHSVDLENLDIFDKFLYQAKLGLGFAQMYPKYNRLSQMFSKEKHNPIYQIAMSALGDTTENVLGKIIEEAVNNGELNEAFDQMFVLKVLSHLFMSFDQIFDDAGNGTSIENLEKYVEFIKTGLAKI